MKRVLLIILCLLFLEFKLFSQEYVYCSIVGTETSISKQLVGVGKSKISIEFDYGNEQNNFKPNVLYGDDGKVLKFNSMMNALNWMAQFGWEFQQAYIITHDKQNVYHYVLRLDISEFSNEELNKIFENFKTRKDFKKKSDN